MTTDNRTATRTAEEAWEKLDWPVTKENGPMIELAFLAGWNARDRDVAPLLEALDVLVAIKAEIDSDSAYVCCDEPAPNHDAACPLARAVGALLALRGSSPSEESETP